MDKKTEYISHGMVNGHMQTLSEWGDIDGSDDNIDVDHLEKYSDVVGAIEAGLWERCDKIPFKKGMHVLMTDPNTDYEDIVSNVYGYDNDEGRKMMEFVWTQLWPDEPIPTEPLPNVKVIGMGYRRAADDWVVARGWYHRTNAGDTFRSVAKNKGVSLEYLLERNKGYPSDKYGPDEPMPAENIIHLRNTGECIDRDDRGLYFHELPKKAQQALVKENGVQPSGAVCPFEGDWMLTHVDGKSVEFVTRHFNEGNVLPEVEGKSAQWRYLLDHSNMDD